MKVSFEHGALLWLLPLALWPWLPARDPAQARYASLTLLDFDRRSLWIGRALRLSGSVAIASLLAALAAPRLPESTQLTVGQGAEIVVLLDRSLSMDQPFGRPSNAVVDLGGQSKAQVAQRLIGEFARQRSDDLFGLVLFSTLPLPVLPFTQRQEVIQAAIGATGTSRALGDTDVGLGLLAAASYFDRRDYSGSRAVVLVSDGGAQLDPPTRDEIVKVFGRNRISLYWLYIRSRFGPGLSVADPNESAADDAVPERALHRFFRSLKTPYRAYQAEDAEALQRAIDDVGRLERAPLQLAVLRPGTDLRSAPLALALVASLVLALAGAWTIRPWRGAP
jgi:mxaC protein